jgi:DNA gyrase inhibitor GyrI
MKMEIGPLGPFNVACIRHVGPYMNVGPFFGELWNWAKERDLISPGATMMGLSYDDPSSVPAEELRYDVCVPVPYGTEGDQRVQVKEIPEAEYAQTTHVGHSRTTSTPSPVAPASRFISMTLLTLPKPNAERSLPCRRSGWTSRRNVGRIAN